MNSANTPLLETERLILRKFTENDLEALFNIHSNEEVNTYLPWFPLTCLEEAASLYRASACQAIIGFGGGSAMDCAKGVGARIAQPNKPINKMRGLLRIHRRLPLLIAVPTTAGTGSEVTLAAVITDDGTHYKYPINDFVLIPRFAVHAWTP